MLELVDRWFLSNHDVMSYGFNSHYSQVYLASLIPLGPDFLLIFFFCFLLVQFPLLTLLCLIFFLLFYVFFLFSHSCQFSLCQREKKRKERKRIRKNKKSTEILFPFHSLIFFQFLKKIENGMEKKSKSNINQK